MVSLVACGGSAAEGPPSESEEKALTYDDPFEGEMPELLADALATERAAVLLTPEQMHALFDYTKEDPRDPRPWLLLARDSMRREWAPIAGRQYRLAIEADARVVGVPYVLDDLLFIATDYIGVDQSDAIELIVDAWGPAALPTIKRELDAARIAKDDDAIRALEVLEAKLLSAVRDVARSAASS